MTDFERAEANAAVARFLARSKVRVIEPKNPRLDPKLGFITEGFSMVSLTDKHRKRNSRR
jgi:hypothetical protein